MDAECLLSCFVYLSLCGTNFKPFPFPVMWNRFVAYNRLFIKEQASFPNRAVMKSLAEPWISILYPCSSCNHSSNLIISIEYLFLMMVNVSSRNMSFVPKKWLNLVCSVIIFYPSLS